MAKDEKALSDYRAERKERIAKAAKKKNKSQADSTLAIRIVIYIILGLAVLGLLVAGLFYFGVPQQYLTAVKVGDQSFTYPEYNYYYTSVYQSLANQAEEQEETYGISLYDTTKDPASQTYETADDGTVTTYADYIRDTVMTTLEQTAYYSKLAEEEGIELNADSQSEIDSTIESITSYAETYGYSKTRYVSLLYGKGMTFSTFKKLLEKQYLVSQYLEYVEEKLADEITDKEIKAKYKEAPETYKVCDIRLFGFTIPDAEDDSEEKDATETEKLAKEYESKITDESSFVELAKQYCEEEDAEKFESDSATIVNNLKYSIVNSNISEDLADWLYSSDRKVGDTTTCTTDDYVYVIYVVTPAYLNKECLVDARHILISYDAIQSEIDSEETDTDETGDSEETEETEVEIGSAEASDGTKISNKDTGYSLDVVVKAYETAQEVLEEFGENETEENFAALAETYSADTGSVGDSGSSTGGLYENIERGTYVTEFENWVYDEDRQPGDTGIIRTEYGYHIMYFVQKHAEPSWKETIREELATTKVDEFETESEEAYEGTATEAKWFDYSNKKALELVNTVYLSTDES